MATRTDGAGVGSALKRLLVGRALSTSAQEHQLLPKSLALPVFSSDTLSSVAYATEEMMLVFITAGVAALTYRIPVAFAIVALLAIVVTSYRQTVRAYPRGGGSYIVARENLGTIPGLIAAAAILTDYVLTVAVSITAGTIAITSAAPSLADHKVLIASGLVALVTAANLRGVKEAGALFALPTYGFVVIVGITIVTGLWQCLSECHTAATADLPGRAGGRRDAVPRPARVLLRRVRAHRRRGGGRRRAGVPPTAGEERRRDARDHGIARQLAVPRYHGVVGPPRRPDHAMRWRNRDRCSP